MEVILRADVPNLGHIGDVVRVKRGYARNYLIPRGLAVVADPRNRRQLEHEKRIAQEKRDRIRRSAEQLAEKLSALRVIIRERAGEEGKLFGSVTNIDIEKALAAEGFSVDRRRIRLAEPIKQLGEYRVPIQLDVGVSAAISVSVQPIEAEAE